MEEEDRENESHHHHHHNDEKTDIAATPANVSKESGIHSPSSSDSTFTTSFNAQSLPKPNPADDDTCSDVLDIIDSVSSIAIEEISNRSSDGDCRTLLDVFLAFKFETKFPREFQVLKSYLKGITHVNFSPDGRNHPLIICLWYISSATNSSPFELVKVFSKYGVDMTSVSSLEGNLLFDLIVIIKLSEWSPEIKKLVLNHVRFHTNADFDWKNKDGMSSKGFAHFHSLHYDDLLPLFEHLRDEEQRTHPRGPVSFQMIPVKRVKTTKSCVVSTNIRIKTDPL